MKTNLLIVCHFKSTRFFKNVFKIKRGIIAIIIAELKVANDLIT
jgi:hypothetical protein